MFDFNTLQTSDVPSVEVGLREVFSWLILLALGPYLAGKLLPVALRLSLKADQKQIFRVRIPFVLTTQLSGAEVAFGFGAFIFMLVIWIILSLAAFRNPKMAYVLCQGFGLDLDTFSSLCFVTGLSTAFLSFSVYIVSVLSFAPPSVAREHSQLIDELSKKGGSEEQQE
jgi:hypothetical protein